MDPSETVFLKFIASYTAENVRDAITGDIDLGKLIVEEFGEDYLIEARHWANLYDGTHPGAKMALADPMESAKRVLAYLKLNRPDLGYEIETYVTLRTASTLGFTIIGSSGQAPRQVQEQQEHLGLSWLAKQIQSLAQVLGYV